MSDAILTITSKNYSSWSLRGWLLCKMTGLEFVEEAVPVADTANPAELLLLSPSILDNDCAAYREEMMALPHFVEWCEAAVQEPDEVEELDVEF